MIIDTRIRPPYKGFAGDLIFLRINRLSGLVCSEEKLQNL